MTSIRSLKLFAPTLLAAALAACGGGGGDGGNDAGTSTASGIPTSASGATGDITTANYATVAVQIEDILALSTDLTGAIDPTAASGGSASAGPKAQAVAGTVFSLATRSSSFGRKTRLSAGGTATVLGTTTQTEACSGGGFATVTFNDADNDGALSAGDSMTIAATNCVEDGETLGGQATVTIAALSDTQVSMSMQFSPMTAGGVTLTGGASIVLAYNGSSYTGTLSLDNVTVTEAGQPTVKMSFQQSASYNGATGVITTSTQGGVVIGSESYWMQQATPFQGYAYAAYPYAGSLSVTDKDGDRVVGVATATSIRYEFYKAGNTGSTPDAVTDVPHG